MGRGLDLFFAGGITFLALSASSFLFKLPDSSFWWLNTLIAFPHFMSTYFVFYSSGGTWKKHPFISLVSPLLLFAVLAFAVWNIEGPWLQRLTHLTFALFFWHYLKQSFGVSLWLGTSRRPTSKEKSALLTAFGIVGGCGYLTAFHFPLPREVFGLQLDPIYFPPLALQLAHWLPSLTVAVCVAALAIGHFHAKKSALRWQGILPLAALWVWMDPMFENQPLRFLLPFFHGLQYLPFPGRVLIHSSSMKDRSSGFKIGGLSLAWGACFAIGYLLIYLFPELISHALKESSPRVPVAVVLFFNLHHYLVDAVAWRFREPAVASRLTKSPQDLVRNAA